jgi:hypothetical protein
MDREQLNQVASSVSAQIVPDIRGEIIQAVNSLRNSPVVAVSPDSIINRTSDQGTCIPISSNNQSMSSVISINDQLGLNVSQQLREKIVNGEYVDIGALLLIQHRTNLIVLQSILMGSYKYSLKLVRRSVI